jgi:hypothetical protein
LNIRPPDARQGLGYFVFNSLTFTILYATKLIIFLYTLSLQNV